MADAAGLGLGLDEEAIPSRALRMTHQPHPTMPVIPATAIGQSQEPVLPVPLWQV